MIDQIAWRMTDFLRATAERSAQGAAALAPPAARRRWPGRIRRVSAVAGTALGLAAAMRPATGARRDTNGSDSSANGSGRSSRTTPSSGRSSSAARSTRRPAKAAGRKATELADRSRDELYEMARKKGVSGRSGMSKKELARALTK